ncbi:transporter substrate-binding domain-containing protein [Duganella sp. CY15W]|uniref:substrate-binding periplasmic protein n=1 Tax=Duganella sp. CY15W TaxID=2692172 RepID=UPI00136C81E0|nr:transporter substrate-binding domain-containing protein [Duganella sp. CY15W]MYM30658.1 transporter substrate-binding domain-containing protein [Duganella sp. CY15W]
MKPWSFDRSLQSGLLMLGLVLTIPANVSAGDGTLKFKILFSQGSIGELYSRRYLSEVCRHIKRTCEFVVVPGKRAVVMMQAGQLDGEIGRLDKFVQLTGSSAYVKASPSYIDRRLLIATRQDNPAAINTLDDLARRPIVIGYLRGYAYFQSVAERYSRAPSFAVNTIDQCFAMLKIRRVDACIYDDLELTDASYLLLQAGELRSTHSLEKTYANLYLQDKSRALLPAVEKAMDELRKSGFEKELQGKIFSNHRIQ